MCQECGDLNGKNDTSEAPKDQSDTNETTTGKFGVRENPCQQYPQARNIVLCSSVPENKEQQWSRMGPLGVMLDPKIIPVTVDSERFQQVPIYMDLIKQHDPTLFAILQETPSKELVDRVNKDRLVTTYMHDYGHEEIIPTDEYKRKIEAAKAAGEVECPQTYSFPVDRCPPNERSIRFIPKTITNEPTFHMKHQKGNQNDHSAKAPEDHPNYVPPISEYENEISTLGAIIMRDNLHGHGRTPREKLKP